MSYRVVEANFIKGATAVSALPESMTPEIAFVGRSNVGKSTLINRLTARKNLARVSKTPGRTKQLNYFELTLMDEKKTKFHLGMVDLPGFGYAKFSKDERERLSRTIVDYATTRDQLKVICLLNDIRHDPMEDELALRHAAFNADKVVFVLLTKADKLTKNERAKRLKSVAGAFQLQQSDLIITGNDDEPAAVFDRIMPVVQS